MSFGVREPIVCDSCGSVCTICAECLEREHQDKSLWRELADDFRRRAEECRLAAAAHFGPKFTRLSGKQQAYEHCAEMLEALLKEQPHA